MNMTTTENTDLDRAKSATTLTARFKEIIDLDGTGYEEQKIPALLEAFNTLPPEEALRLLAKQAANLPRPAAAYH